MFGLREGLPGRIGLCPGCHSERLLQNYLEKDGEEIVERRHRWKDWSQTPEHLRERQRRHWLLTKTKPREPANPRSDPLEIVFDWLELLGTVRLGLRSNVRAREHLDEAEELVKQLGWGPGPRE